MSWLQPTTLYDHRFSNVINFKSDPNISDKYYIDLIVEKLKYHDTVVLVGVGLSVLKVIRCAHSHELWALARIAKEDTSVVKVPPKYEDHKFDVTKPKIVMTLYRQDSFFERIGIPKPVVDDDDDNDDDDDLPY